MADKIRREKNGPTMKTSKALQSNHAPEECGVWLDTVELKGKAKQKKTARSISKMLNPLAKGAGYSVAVVFNFTQTRTEMPRTRQSSISSFFSPRCKDKMETGGAVRDRNDERGIRCEVREEQPEEVRQDVHREECPDELEQKVRRVREEQPEKVDRGQGSVVKTNQTAEDFCEFDLSEKLFQTEAEGKTSTQKPFQIVRPRHKDDDKENGFLPGSFSPPKKRPRQRDREDSLAPMFTQDSDGFRVIAHRFRRSPLKKRDGVNTCAKSKPAKTLFDAEDALFTQDSQGNLVIKH
ncbi:aurora kinase A- and ninein-interacting protein [Syngnathoides biaculeatus]|uniref:aurora kinase A- and ninein-interacting protein n=1 Tax=Syngnathoides biaculeatus TaxID=300417 RepID=UPI002ADE85AC|nr:aurora kinase A- and ninein-interacting protein [Syngnathoides biaculeatus]